MRSKLVGFFVLVEAPDGRPGLEYSPVFVEGIKYWLRGEAGEISDEELPQPRPGELLLNTIWASSVTPAFSAIAENEEWKPDYNVCPRRVVCAAQRKEGRIVTGARHYDKVMRAQIEASEGIAWWKGSEGGFIDQFGDFLTREEAWVVAGQQGQMFRPGVSSPGTLYSENLY